MVHPPGPGTGTPRKRHAAPHAPPAGVVKMGAGSSSDKNFPVDKRARVAQPSSSQLHLQDMYHNIISQPPPLGLQLRKSESFLDLLQTILSKANSTAGRPVMEDSISAPPMKKDAKSGAPAASERLKASNFPANFLKIGTWEYTSQYEGDLVAKCYYAKQKLVWEVLDGGFKSKIELKWSHITALKATFPEDGDGTLDIVLSRPPIFFQETSPQPRKHTLWQLASDFTGGQASMYRRHILRCPSSLLSKNFDKIIQCDQRLYQLSQQPVIILDSPVFESRSYIFENPNESDGPPTKFPHFAPQCVDSPVFDNDRLKPLMLNQPEPFYQPMNLGGGVASDVQEKSPSLRNLSVPGLRSSMSVDDLLNHIDSCITQKQAAGGPPLANTEMPAKELLQIAESLLSDSHGTPSTDENFLMARVNSLYSLLEKDTAPATISTSEHNGGTIDEPQVGLDDDFDGRIADGAVPPVISRKDSFADLLESLPRISSVSQFLFDISEDSENSGSRS